MHEEPEEVTVAHDVPAVLIPDGKTVTVPKGTTAWITQSLGGTYTIQLPTGLKYRIDGAHAEAIGKEPSNGPETTEDQEPLEPEEAEKWAWKALRQVHDPEIPVNLVDLGLIYTLKMHKRGDGRLFAEVRMSLTAPGCGMGDVMVEDVKRVLKTVPGVDTVDAKVVFDPVWNPGMMSDAAKLRLGLL